MKLSTIATSTIATITLATAIATSPVYAGETKQAVKGAATFYSAAIIGGMAAGPVGFFLGAIGGAHLHEQNKEAIATKKTLNETKIEVAQLEQQVTNKQGRIEKLEKSAANKLEFAVMFPTGDDQLTHQDIQRINSLSTYLNDNPKLKIRLDGHADPRGTDEYNNVLSQERANAVAKAFTERGISENRITWFAHGSSLSTAYNGDLEAYAMERKVKIEVYVEDNESVAAAN